MKVKKGMYGYRTSHKKFQTICVLVCLAAILLQLGARTLTEDKAVRNILTVMAVLTVLPMANFASPLLASFKYRTPAQSFHDRLLPYENSCILLYDLIITSREQVIPADAAAVHPTGIYVYSPQASFDVKKAESYINDMLMKNRISLHARIMTEEAAFLRRLASLDGDGMEQQEDEGVCAYAAALLKSISM